MHVLGGLREVFKDDGNVHVDDDEEGDDQVGEKENHSLAVAATVTIGLGVCRGSVAVFIVHETSQHAVPACRSGHLEEEGHGAEEGLKVEHVVNAVGVLDVHEEGHAKDGVDEHDQEE